MSVQKATKCYQLLCCLWHAWEIVPAAKSVEEDPGIWCISVHRQKTRYRDLEPKGK